MPFTRIGTNEFMSEAVTAGGMVWIAGTVGTGAPEGDVAAQTRDILAQIDRRLALANSDRSLMTFANIWLSDIGDWAEVNGSPDRPRLPVRP